MYRSSTSETAFVMPQAICWLCPITIPGVPGNLAPSDAMGDLPGFWCEAQQLKFDREMVLVLLNEGVNAACVCTQDALNMRLQLPCCGCSCAMHAEATSEAISFNSYLAEDLRESTGPNTPVEFHLP